MRWHSAPHPVPHWQLTAKSTFDAVASFLAAWPDLGFQPPDRPRDRTMMSDNYYYPLPLDVLQGIMRASPLPPPDPGSSLPELADCDDYALGLKVEMARWFRNFRALHGVDLDPPAIGLILTGDHALCTFVTCNDQGNLIAGVCDPSRPDYPVSFTPDSATRALFQAAPIRWLFF